MPERLKGTDYLRHLVELSISDRTALETLARRDGNTGVRARIVLAAAKCATIAAVSRETGATRLTVRKWLGIFRERGGVGLENIRPAPPARETPPDIPPCTVPAALAPSGRAPSARLCIECAVRRAAALGIVPPGGLLPDRAWFAKRFNASLAAVQAAFASLSEQGFTVARTRTGTRLAARLPFEGHFLLIQEGGSLDGRLNGINVNMAGAVRRAEALRPGTKWDILQRSPETVDRLRRDIAMHRWRGVFMRTAHTDTDKWRPGEATIASVPDVPMIVATIFEGTAVSPLVRALHFDDLEPWGDVFARCRRDGWRRVAIADTCLGMRESGYEGIEAKIRAEAARFGVEIPDGAYLSPTSGEHPSGVRRCFELMFRLIRPGDIDAILVRRDDLLKPVAAALRARWGEEAALRLPFAVWSTGDFLPDEGMHVRWHGPDLVSIVLDFMDRCEA